MTYHLWCQNTTWCHNISERHNSSVDRTFVSHEKVLGLIPRWGGADPFCLEFLRCDYSYSPKTYTWVNGDGDQYCLVNRYIHTHNVILKMHILYIHFPSGHVQRSLRPVCARNRSDFIRQSSRLLPRLSFAFMRQLSARSQRVRLSVTAATLLTKVNRYSWEILTAQGARHWSRTGI